MSGFSAWFPSSGISTKFDPKSTPTRPQICPTSSPKIPQINLKSHPGAGIDVPRLVAPSWPSYNMSFAGHIKNRVREKNVSLKGGVRLWPTRRWFLQSGGVGQVGKVGKSRGYLTCFFFHFLGVLLWVWTGRPDWAQLLVGVDWGHRNTLWNTYWKNI